MSIYKLVFTQKKNGHLVKDSETKIDFLTKYIPAEIVGCYITALGFLNSENSDTTSLVAFIVFVAATPFVYYLLQLIKQRQLHIVRIWSKKATFECIASTISFSVWGLGFPNSPISKVKILHGLIAGIAIFISMIFGLLQQLFQIESE